MKNLLKRLLSRRVIDRLLSWQKYLDFQLVTLVRHSRLLSVIYYGLFSSEFRREMHAVVNGRYHYHQTQQATAPSSFMLRRNIHRLEKGLCMQPRRDVFAQGYINETTDVFAACVDAAILTPEEYAWSHDVLAEYFNVVVINETIERAQTVFQGAVARASLASLDGTNKPFSYSQSTRTAISFDAFRSLCKNRNSVRWFKPQSVPRAILDEAITVASTAPSACNRQPFEFYIFDEPERAQQIGAIPMGTAGFSQNFQCIIVVVGNLSAYPFEKDRHIIYIDSALASMQLLLALETRGLSSCIINWPDVERHEQQMASELGLESYQRPTMLISVGYADEAGMIPYSAKKIATDVARREK